MALKKRVSVPANGLEMSFAWSMLRTLTAKPFLSTQARWSHDVGAALRWHCLQLLASCEL